MQPFSRLATLAAVWEGTQRGGNCKDAGLEPQSYHTGERGQEVRWAELKRHSYIHISNPFLCSLLDSLRSPPRSYQTFRKGDKGIAAQWDAQAGSWIEVGEIVGGAGAKETLDGKEYDHVLPIEIDQQGGGVATLKIGYNVGDNPFVTAQEFIDKYR